MNVVLSRRNLLVLLSKLDRVALGEKSARQIIKPNGITITAEEDDVHYGNRGHGPGPMHPADEERIGQYKHVDNSTYQG